jgi:hypothetical protein
MSFFACRLISEMCSSRLIWTCPRRGCCPSSSAWRTVCAPETSASWTPKRFTSPTCTTTAPAQTPTSGLEMARHPTNSASKCPTKEDRKYKKKPIFRLSYYYGNLCILTYALLCNIRLEPLRGYQGEDIEIQLVGHVVRPVQTQFRSRFDPQRPGRAPSSWPNQNHCKLHAEIRL